MLGSLKDVKKENKSIKKKEIKRTVRGIISNKKVHNRVTLTLK